MKTTTQKQKANKRRGQSKLRAQGVPLLILILVVSVSAAALTSVPDPRDSAESFVEKYQNIDQSMHSTYHT